MQGRTLLAVLVCVVTRPGAARLTCSKMVVTVRPDFHLVAPCSASGMNVIARSTTSSVKGCSQFAYLKKGLAFNFVTPGEQPLTHENCLIYDCPEFDVLHSIRREKQFDYYSMFADPLPIENSTCVLGVGMFLLSEKPANYTDAVKKCREAGGELANVLTSSRTAGLSNMVNGMQEGRRGLKRAYIGLDDMLNEGRFVTAAGKLLSCFEFRSWAPGEPRNRRKTDDCVVIDGQKGWRVVNCSLRLPFICELLPKGPFPIPDDQDTDACEIDLKNRVVTPKPPEGTQTPATVPNQPDDTVLPDFVHNSILFHWLSL